VHYVVTASDGQSDASGTAEVMVKPVGAVPIVTEPFAIRAYAGQEVTIVPLEHARGGSAPLKLSGVPAKPHVTTTPDFETGKFRFISEEVRTQYVEYAITDGQATQTGVVRVDVQQPPDRGSQPITVPHTAFVREQKTSTIDVTSSDIDPGGGVLLITGTTDVPEESGIRVEILEQAHLRITLTKPLDRPAQFRYRITNGFAEADGTVTVIQIPTPTHAQAPIANPDTVSVRVGDAIDIPVLENDEHPEGEAIELAPKLTEGISENAGLLFVTGSRLRYLAPERTGNFTAVYRITAPDGQFADAEVKIAVREADEATNNPPVPHAVTARVLAGSVVRIPIPLTGTDPDGDSVQLLGQDTSPEKGTVSEVGSHWIEYEAAPYAAGTDTFSYSVIDSLGARAHGSVRIGISARQDGARNPIAIADEVHIRPGKTVAVQVLANDSDPDGGPLTLTSVQPTTPQGSAEIDGDIVRVYAPLLEGRYGFVYEISNEYGGTSSNFLTVVVNAAAPLSHPVAADTVLSLSDIIDRSTIDVDVLASVFFADGDERTLDVSIVPGYNEYASLSDNRTIRVHIRNRSQIIPFRVTHPEDSSIVAYAFIRVPGYDDALPQLRKGIPRITVESEASLAINLNDYVIARGGKKVRVTDAATVKATHTNRQSPIINDTTLRYTSEDKYFGPASISFHVTDGDSATDPNGRVATLVLPITVTPRENQPPVFTGGVIDCEPGQSKTIDLTKMTNYPYPDDHNRLAYTLIDAPTPHISASIDGQKITLTASSLAQNGTKASATLSVRDSAHDGKPGRIDIRIVPSTRPMAVPADDRAIVPRGQTTVVDVLANDNATNPFPSNPLRVVAVRGLDSRLPDGMTVTPSANNQTLSVTVTSEVQAADTTLHYQVADVTNDPGRYAWGTVRLSVQDQPDPVSDLRVTSFSDMAVTVAFVAGSFNNSPITGFDITSTRHDGETIATMRCTATSCVLPTPGNGERNAFTIAVNATNAIGPSTSTSLGSFIWSDVIPAAPTGLVASPLDGGLEIFWDVTPPPEGGSPVRNYVVTVNGESLGDIAAGSCSARCTFTALGLQNGAHIPFTVSARNEAYDPLAAWNSSEAAGTPYGRPHAGDLVAETRPGDGTVTVNWSAFDPNGDPVTAYYVQRLNSKSPPNGQDTCSPSTGGNVDEQSEQLSGSASSYTFTGLTAQDTTYFFAVWGYNRAGCAVTGIIEAVPRPTPGAVTAINGVMTALGTHYDYVVTSITPNAPRYRVRASSSADPTGNVLSLNSSPRAILGLGFGTPVSFEVRACTVLLFGYESCSAWSSPHSSPEEPVDYMPRDLRFNTDTISWAGDPNNGGLVASYRCSRTGNPSHTATPAPGSMSCRPPGFGSRNTMRLEVTVNGRSHEVVP
jgi:hypothetical protein